MLVDGGSVIVNVMMPHVRDELRLVRAEGREDEHAHDLDAELEARPLDDLRPRSRRAEDGGHASLRGARHDDGPPYGGAFVYDAECSGNYGARTAERTKVKGCSRKTGSRTAYEFTAPPCFIHTSPSPVVEIRVFLSRHTCVRV